MTVKGAIKTVADITVNLAARVAGFQTALADVHDTETEIRAEHQAAQQERQRILSSLPPRTEVLAWLQAEVGRLGAAWREAHGPGVVAACRPAEIAMAGSPLASALGGGVLELGAVCALMPGVMETGLANLVDAVAFEEGPPLAERPRLLRELDARLVDLEAQHTALCDRAAELDITLELMPGEHARRVQAGQRHAAAQSHNALNASAIRRGVVEPMK
jgi:hypothetical protein